MEVTEPPRDGKKEILDAYFADSRVDSKMLISSGSICDKNGCAFVLPSVVIAENKVSEILLRELNESATAPRDCHTRFRSCKSYLPMDGLKAFLDAISPLIWGDKLGTSPNIQSIQTPGGTAAIRMIADTIKKLVIAEKPLVWLSSPTWGNHKSIFVAAGFNFKTYPYSNIDGTNDLNFENMMNGLEEANEYDTILVQGNCHNPTGLDLSNEQWMQLYKFCQKKKLILVVDMAFVGMAKGINEDFIPFRQLANESVQSSSSIPWFFAASYSKCFTMYNERVGSSSVICGDSQISSNIKGHMKFAARASYSNPPEHGSRIITYLLNDRELRELWEKEISDIGKDIINRRNLYISEMEKLGNDSNSIFNLKDRNTIFLHYGLTKEQNEYLRNHHGIYGWSNHFNILKVPESKMNYVCSCILDAKGKQ